MSTAAAEAAAAAVEGACHQVHAILCTTALEKKTKVKNPSAKKKAMPLNDDGNDDDDEEGLTFDSVRLEILSNSATTNDSEGTQYTISNTNDLVDSTLDYGWTDVSAVVDLVRDRIIFSTEVERASFEIVAPYIVSSKLEERRSRLRRRSACASCCALLCRPIISGVACMCRRRAR